MCRKSGMTMQEVAEVWPHLFKPDGKVIYKSK